MPSASRYYLFLDGLRAVSILGVMIAHISNIFQTKRLAGAAYHFLTYLGPYGHLGVDVFFVISGFLITGILIENFDQPIRIQRFFIRRFFKIIPQYFVMCLAGILLFFWALTDPALLKDKVVGHPSEFISNFFFLQGYVGTIFTLSHTWTIAIEEHFYIVYPFLIQGLFLRIKNPLQRRRWLIFILSSLILLIITSRHIHYHDNTFLGVFVLPNVTQTTFYRRDALLFGCILKLLEPYYLKIKGPARVVLSYILLALSISIFVYFNFKKGAGDLIICWDKYFLAYISAGCLLVSAQLEGIRLFSWILNHPFLGWIGKNSYGIYLWHFILIIPFLKCIPFLGMHWTIMSYALCALGLGALTTSTLERYFLNIRQEVSP